MQTKGMMSQDIITYKNVIMAVFLAYSDDTWIRPSQRQWQFQTTSTNWKV